MSTERSKAVVVGVDQSAGAKAALQWAAAEAALRGAPLLIATSWSGIPHDEYEPNIADPVPRAAATFLDDAATGAREPHPYLDVDTALMSDEPVEGLLRLAQDAELVVVGRRGLNRFLRLLLGSVSQQLVAHSPVPVVAVSETPAPASEPGAVVVGVARGVPEPLAFAFAEAQARGAPLIVVRAAADSHGASRPGELAEVQADELRELQSLMEVVQGRHPSVEVSTRVLFETPEAALVEAAEGASLVVVGRHRRHARYGLPLGQVPHRVLHLSDLPVAVVPN